MTSLADADLSQLVDEWLDWTQAAAILEVTPAKVRTMIREHQLAGAVPKPGAGQLVPAAFLDDDGLVVKGLSGLLVLMHDNGYDDRECIAWLFLDADLPGRPIDALRENRGSEVKRRAQAMGFEPTPRKGGLWLAMLGVLVLAVLTWALNQGGFSGGGRDGDTDPGTLTVVALSSLPAEAQQTVALIDAGGPFPYDRDGIVFENRERLLPSEPTGYYHEYTVPTPGSSDRGARRIITGGAREMYWTDDHYQSFERIAR